MIAAEFLDSLEQSRSDPSGADKVALCSQKGQLVGDIQLAKLLIELDAVENGDWISEADMLGTQVPVSFDDPTRFHPLVE
jgi:hypothetical protein